MFNEPTAAQLVSYYLSHPMALYMLVSAVSTTPLLAVIALRLCQIRRLMLQEGR